MRHQKASLKLSRTTSHRIAMFRNMVTSLFKHERIRTTEVKAKELRRWAEHVITLAKKGNLHARRQALAIIREKSVVHKLFEEAQEKYGKTAGGYTRIVKIERRAGDAAPMSMVELIVPGEGGKKKAKKKTSKAATGKKKAEGETQEEMKPPAKKEKKAKARKQPAEKKKAAEAKTQKKSIKAAQPKKKTKTEKTETTAR
jgi:large subunit ribosomal protein L17